MGTTVKTKVLLIIILIEVIIIGYFMIYPRLFKLESTIEFSVNPHKITFYFSQPVVKTSFEDSFQIYPEVKGTFIWDDYNRKVTFNPYYLTYDYDYTISVKNVRSYTMTNLQEKKIKFRFERPSSFNLASLAKVMPAKLPISEKKVFVKPRGDIVAIGQPQITKEKYIDIDISDQVLTAYNDGQIVGVYEVSTGRYNMPTPLGDFKVLSKEKNHWSRTYKLYMPFSMQFLSGFYIHELPYWPGGYREGADHLGTRVSHGCVRLGIGSAEEVYNFAEIGTPVIIHQ